MKIYIKYIIAAERQRGSTLILTFEFLMRSASFVPDPPDLCIVEISIFVCGWLAMLDFLGIRIFRFQRIRRGGGGQGSWI